MELSSSGLSSPLILMRMPEYWIKRVRFKFRQSSFPVWIVIAVEAGSFAYEIEGFKGEASQGDVVIIPPDTMFTREITEELTYFFTPFRLDESHATYNIHVLEHLRSSLGYLFKSSEQDRLFNTFRQLKRVYDKSDTASEWACTHFFADIWLQFCMEAQHSLEQTNRKLDPLMEEAKEWITHYAFDNISLKVLADTLGLHPVQLSRRFQSYYGMLPSNYLTTLRMEKAKTLLTQTDYKLEQIAQMCGYDNGYYFSRIFTKHHHMNPSIYRKTHRSLSL